MARNEDKTRCDNHGDRVATGNPGRRNADGSTSSAQTCDPCGDQYARDSRSGMASGDVRSSWTGRYSD